MIINVTNAELTVLLQVAPELASNPILYVLDSTQTNVLSFVTLATVSPLIVTLSEAFSLTTFQTMFADRTMVQVTSLST